MNHPYANNKHHLYVLPQLNQDTFSFSEGTSDELCLIIPIFTTYLGEHALITVTKSACHALRSWLHNSDITDFSIPIYIYCDVSQEPIIKPILDENGVPAEMIMSAEFEGQQYTQFLSPLFDDRFQDFKNLLIVDVDLFAHRSLENEKHKFFSMLQENEGRDNTIGTRLFKENKPIFEDRFLSFWWAYLCQTSNPPDFNIPIKEQRSYWVKTVCELTDARTARQFILSKPISYVQNPLLFVNQTHAIEKEWIKKAMSVLGESESILTIYSIFFKEEFWNMENLFLDILYSTLDTHDAGLAHWGQSVDQIVYDRIFKETP